MPGNPAAVACANPLFLSFVQEWLDSASTSAAAAANPNVFRVYQRAHASLRACPLVFTHPTELRQLAGFGPKLVDRLTDRLRRHCEENGLPMPTVPAPPGRTGVAVASRGRPRGSNSGPGGDRSRRRAAVDEDGEHSSGNEQPQSPKRRRRAPAPYAPALRSGPFGLLVALATLGPEDGGEGSAVSKPRLIELAQPHCDTSYTVPAVPAVPAPGAGPGRGGGTRAGANSFYTAWSSMRTLLQRDLVCERGGRALAGRRYALTDAGWEVARRVRRAAAEMERVDHGLPDHSLREPSPAMATAAGTRPSTSTCHATMGIDLYSDPEDNGINIDAHANVNTSINSNSTSNECGPDPYADENHADGTRPLIPLPPGSFTIELVLDTREIRARSDRDYMANELHKLGVRPTVRALPLGDVLWVAKVRDPAVLATIRGVSGDSVGGIRSTIVSESGNGDANIATDELVLDWIVERKRLDDLLASIVDGRFREQKFRLARCGVRNIVYLVEQSPLPLPGLPAAALAGGFMNGGDPDPAAAAAAATTAASARQLEMLHSAIASTAVVDGYLVRQTRNIDESIRYLARMTRLLRRQYGVDGGDDCQSQGVTQTAASTPASRTVTAIPRGPTAYAALKRSLVTATSDTASDTTTYSPLYSTFAALAVKSASLTLRDVFLKMLLRTRGLTPERALEVQRRWRTPRALVEALRETGDEGGGSNDNAGADAAEKLLLRELGGLVGHRRFGLPLVRRMVEIWG